MRDGLLVCGRVKRSTSLETWSGIPGRLTRCRELSQHGLHQQNWSHRALREEASTIPARAAVSMGNRTSLASDPAEGCCAVTFAVFWLSAAARPANTVRVPVMLEGRACGHTSTQQACPVLWNPGLILGRWSLPAGSLKSRCIHGMVFALGGCCVSRSVALPSPLRSSQPQSQAFAEKQRTLP